MLAEVVVDVQSFRFDQPLTYLIPGKLIDRARTGSLVRVPLRHRKVRGWITEVLEGTDPRALPLAAVSGRGPLFDDHLLTAMRRMARRFVSPLPTLLSLLTPLRLGRPGVFPPARPVRKGPPAFTLWRPAPGEDPGERYAEQIETVLEGGRGAMVLVPEVQEGSRILEGLASKFDSEAAVVHSGRDPAERAAALWAVAAGTRRVVLGGRAAVFAPAFPLGLVIVHSEHDRSYKEPRAPYYDAREVALARAEEAGAEVFMVSSTPSLVTLSRSAGWTTREPERALERARWPPVELLDPPRTGIPRRAVAAIIEARRRGERTLVLLPRARSTPGGPGPERVAQFISRVVPQARIARADRPALGPPGALRAALEADVVVATEAALAEVDRPPISTAIALEADLLLERPFGRAVEEGFQILWSLGALVAGRTPRGRLLVETSTPDHYAIQALVRGDYHYFARHEFEVRASTKSPPASSLIVLRAADFAPEFLDALAGLAGSEVLGPVNGRRGLEVLLKANDLEPVLDPLRDLVAAAPGRILVEVDPRDW